MGVNFNANSARSKLTFSRAKLAGVRKSILRGDKQGPSSEFNYVSWEREDGRERKKSEVRSECKSNGNASACDM